MRILVAMSGGIDSSVVAHMLKEQGHDVIGVRFTLWVDPLAPALAQILPSKCCNAQTITRANAVAKALDIDLHILDLEDEFKRDVVDPFLKEYALGRTPNPCIGCNRTVKFGRLLELSDELGCDKLATGHYARIKHVMVSGVEPRHADVPFDPSQHGRAEASSAQDDTSSVQDDTRTPNTEHRTPNYHLLQAIDHTKDQSYYLYGLSQDQLSRIMFPLGEIQKRDVYILAKKYGVPYEEITYRESQDLCFFPEKEPKEFLKRHLKNTIKEGDIIRASDKTKLGTHKGLPLYTIGQRRGLGVGGLKIPLEVVQKDCTSNTILVEDKGSTLINELKISSIRWVDESYKNKKEQKLDCCLRSLSPRTSITLIQDGESGMIHFATPQSPQAPGQHAVFYNGEEVLGGGVIA